MKLWAISGLAGAGKDEFANGLVERCGVQKIALADNLKNMCQLIFDISPWHTTTQAGKAFPLPKPITITEALAWKVISYMALTHTEINDLSDNIWIPLVHKLPHKVYTVRELLQFVGTDICRFVSPAYHVAIVLKQINETNQHWVITDCRFPNERAAVKNRGGTLVLIERPGIRAAADAHLSETSLGSHAEYDLVVQNDGDKSSLHNRAIMAFQGDINV